MVLFTIIDDTVNSFCGLIQIRSSCITACDFFNIMPTV